MPEFFSGPQRVRLFYVGASLAILPALAFMPAFAYLVIQPSIPHASLVAWIAFPVMALAEGWGVSRLAISCVSRPFGLINVLSFGALLVLVIIVACVGLFLAVLAGGMA